MSSSPFAVLKRWTWLLIAVAVGASAVVMLAAMRERELRARIAQTHAATFAAELRESVREVAAAGRTAPAGDRARVLPPAIARAAQLGEWRLARLDAALRDPSRTDLLHRRLRHLPRLAATTRSPAVFEQRLRRSGAQIAGDAERIAREQRTRAATIARETVLGRVLLLMLAIALVAHVLVRRERRHARELHELAHRDPLTGLANRRRLDADLAALSPQIAQRRPVQIAILDLDGFKAINDTLGHEGGDALLARFAGALRDAAGDDGAVYRLGGDEFCVVSVPGRPIAGAVTRAAAGAATPVRASVGIAVWPSEAPDARGVMRLADRRMYAAKTAGALPAAAAA